jgi:ribosomal protein S18 acetylase RimI-like enzyme
VEIRIVRPDEHERLGEITVVAYRAINPPHADADLDEYEAELRDIAGRAAGADVLVAVDGDGDGDGERAVLGGVTYVPDRSSPWAEFDEPDAAGIRMLAVAPEAQGRGVGEALTRACIDRAVAAGRAQILLHSTDWMTTAHRIYERLGFQRDPSFDREIEDEFWLRGFRLRLDDRRAVTKFPAW